MTDKFRQEYLASLYGFNWDDSNHRLSPKISKPAKYTDLDKFIRNEYERFVGGSELDNIWVCSDHHFGHKNIIQYARRPFVSVYEMNQFMLKNHNKLVAEDDIVFMLGDFNLGSADNANKFLDQMNGYKIFIVGNHDWNGDYKNKLKKYNVDEMHISYYLDWAGVLMTHAPFYSHVPFVDGFVNIHGHIHDKKIESSQYINACVEHTMYKPVKLRTLIS